MSWSGSGIPQSNQEFVAGLKCAMHGPCGTTELKQRTMRVKTADLTFADLKSAKGVSTKS